MKFAAILMCCMLSPLAATAASEPKPPLPAYASDDEHLTGRIARVESKYLLTVRDDRGYLDHVRLRNGTVINPIGLTLTGGMRVTVYGRVSGKEFLADEIDTPYRTTTVVPVYPPYAPYGGYGSYGPGGLGTSVIINSGGWRR